MRQKKIDFALSRMEGADPMEFSGKEFNEAHDRVRKKIEKRLKLTTHINEADRHVVDAKPKHLFSGKRGAGSADRR